MLIQVKVRAKGFAFASSSAQTPSTIPLHCIDVDTLNYQNGFTPGFSIFTKPAKHFEIQTTSH